MRKRSRVPVLPHRTVNYHALLKARMVVVHPLQIPKLNLASWGSRAPIEASEDLSEFLLSNTTLNRLQARPLRLPPRLLKRARGELFPNYLPVDLGLTPEGGGGVELVQLCFRSKSASQESTVPSLGEPIIRRQLPSLVILVCFILICLPIL